jgi:phosphonoacetate hydrolase
MLLSLTDYVQHKYPPGAPESNSFYQRLDNALGQLHALGVVVAITADHGMSQKSKKDGTPNVIFLQDLLDKQFGVESTKVISPITDPYVAHHGSLGGFARIYCLAQTRAESVANNLKHIPGIEAIFDKRTACRVLDLPSDIEADVVVVANAGTALGTSEKSHDLSALSGNHLRSHGGLSERDVPFILSAPLNSEYSIRAKGPIMNYEILDFAINGTLA